VVAVGEGLFGLFLQGVDDGDEGAGVGVREGVVDVFLDSLLAAFARAGLWGILHTSISFWKMGSKSSNAPSWNG
jgi:hypothetical protein